MPRFASPAGGAGGGRPSRPPGRRPGGAAGSPQGGRLGVPACPTAAGRAHKHHGTRTSPGPSPLAALRRPPGEAAPQDPDSPGAVLTPPAPTPANGRRTPPHDQQTPVPDRQPPRPPSPPRQLGPELHVAPRMP